MAGKTVLLLSVLVIYFAMAGSYVIVETNNSVEVQNNTNAGDTSDEKKSSVKSTNPQSQPPTTTEAQTKFETTEADDTSDEEKSSVKSTNLQSQPPTTTKAQTKSETTEADETSDEEKLSVKSTNLQNQPPTTTEARTKSETTEADDTSSVKSTNLQNQPPTATEAQTKSETTEADNTSGKDESSVKSTNLQSQPPTTTAQTKETTEADDTSAKTESVMESSSKPQPAYIEPRTECDTSDTEYKFFESTKACYKFHTNRMTWDDAQATCVREGGHLAVVNSQDEADYFMRHFPMHSPVLYLGFYFKDGVWVTIHGQTLKVAGYEKWRKYEPSNLFKGQNCGAMYRDGTFSDVPCYYKAFFICEKDSNSPPATAIESEEDFRLHREDYLDKKMWSEPTYNECGRIDTGYIFFKSTNTCYRIHTDTATWDDAETTCVREGGHLAVVNSQDEADFFVKHYPLRSPYVFLGFHMLNGSWVTIQGQSLAEAGYENWHEHEPNNQFRREYCGAMYRGGTFNDVSCDYYKATFICEKVPYYLLRTNFDNTAKREYTFFERTQSYYKVHTEKATWSDAENICAREGGHLAIIDNDNEKQILARQFPSGFRVIHIGFDWNFEILVTIGDSLAESGYVKVEEPKNMTRNQYCVCMYPDGSLDDVRCSYKTAFICEKSTNLQNQPPVATEAQSKFETTEADDTSDEEGSSGLESTTEPSSTEPTSTKAYYDCSTRDRKYIFYAKTGGCYKVHKEEATWNYAEATCIREGGHLAVINSQAEADFFKWHFPRNSYQIFLGFHLREKSWVTIEGQTLTEAGYENWNVDEPNNATGDQFCGSMYSDGTFDDISCSYTTAFICEKKPNAENHLETATDI